MTLDIRYQIYLDGKPDPEATAAASAIEVRESVRDMTTFSITLAIDVDGDTFAFIEDPRLQPGANKLLSVVAEVDGEAQVLVHGVITDRETVVKHGGPGSFIKVEGADRRILMDRNAAKFRTHKGKVSSIVRALLTEKEYFNETEVEDAPCEIFSPDQDRQLAQTGTDLDVLKMLASLAGVEFWVDWQVESSLFKGAEISEKAYFKSQPPRNQGSLFSSLPIPPLLAPPGAPSIRLNTGDEVNTVLDFRSEVHTEVPKTSGPVSRVDFRRGRIQSTSTDGTQEPLGEEVNPSGELQRSILTAGGIDTARCTAAAALNDAAWAVTANVTTTAYSVCGLIRPRQVVKVQGTGAVNSGDFFVWAVNHEINPADHSMAVELRRNALGES